MHIKKLESVPLITVVFALLSLGFTAQEAEQIYRDNGCSMVSQTSEQICFNCTPTPAPECVSPVGAEVAIHWTPDWDLPIPEPIPDPEPIPEPPPEPEPPPSCIPTWCSLPVQACDLEPLMGGVDSCGNPCSKPSTEWPNCRHEDGTISPKEGL